MYFKLSIVNKDAKDTILVKEFKSKDIKYINEMKLPKEDKAGEFLYVIKISHDIYLPTYYYKISDNLDIPVSTDISIENNVDELTSLDPTTISSSDNLVSTLVDDTAEKVEDKEVDLNTIILKDIYKLMVDINSKLDTLINKNNYPYIPSLPYPVTPTIPDPISPFNPYYPTITWASTTAKTKLNESE